MTRIVHPGHTPLHVAALYQSAKDLRDLQDLLTSHPHYALQPDNDGNLPLHEAAVMQLSFVYPHKILHLIRAAPQTVMTKNTFGQTPLHNAVQSQSYMGAQVLVQAAPDALDVKDKFKKTPLQYAVQNPVMIAGLVAVQRLRSDQWAVVPRPCDGLERALKHVLHYSDADIGHLMTRLNATVLQGVQRGIVCTAILANSAGVWLPNDIVKLIVAQLY